MEEKIFFKRLHNYKGLSFWLIITTLGTTFFGTMYPYFIGKIVDDIFLKGTVDDLFNVIKEILLVFVFHQVFRIFNLFTLKQLDTKFVFELKNKILSNIINLDAQILKEKSSGDLIQTIEYDSKAWVDYLYNNIAYGISDWLEFLSQLIFIFILSPTLFVLTCICMPVATYSTKYYEKKILFKESSTIEILSNINSFVTEIVYNMEEIRLINAIRGIIKKVNKKYQKMEKGQIEIQKLKLNSNRVNVGIAVIMKILFIVVSFLLVRKGKLTIGIFIATYSYFESSLEIFRDLNDKSNNKNKYFVSMKRTEKYLGNEIYEDNGALSQKIYDAPHSLTVKDVGFSYENKHVLENFNAEFHSGKLNYIIGKSGCGKSTLIDIMSGLYSVNEGSILLDSKKINETEFVEKISVMHQENYLFNNTLRFNLTFGKDIDDFTIWEALKSVNMDQCVMQLKNKLDTNVNRKNLVFSGGEMQRLMIVRILLMNKPVLLFDEPISALDEKNRKEIISFLRQISTNKLIIIVTHNIEVITKEDNVLAINEMRSENNE